jgi:hypothetical protein
MTMTTSYETMTDPARRGQEAGPWKSWADSVPWFASTPDAKLHGAVEFVDKMFDFYHHMLAYQSAYYHHVLACQQEYTKGWLAVTTLATTKAGSAAQAAAKEAAPKRDTRDGAMEAAPKRS